MTGTDYSTLYAAGCNEGQNTPDGAAKGLVLDFGQPWFDGTNYGTLVFENLVFHSTTDIENGVKGYLSGFYACSPDHAFLTLAVGTSNFGSGVSYGHGVAWANMVHDLNTWINQPPSYGSKESAAAGIDIEPGFGTVSITRSWVDGYTSAYIWPSYYFNYGSCDGCPYSGCLTCTPNNNWTVEDIWYVSWGAAPAYPLPEIYTTNGVLADQWYRMSLYSYTQHGLPMDERGVFTQWQACQDHPAANCHANGTDNTPAMGWGQLYDALNADTRTAQTLDWSTDVTWQQQ